MKVVHVLNHFLPDHVAGTEMYVYSLSKCLLNEGIELVVVIPNYGEKNNASYFFEGIRVVRYGEPSIPNRDLRMGRVPPLGIEAFSELLRTEKPDIVHFHELAGSIGVGIFHVQRAKELGFKVILTMHLARYTCQTGTMSYFGTPCDGVINLLKCSKCSFRNMGLGTLSTHSLGIMARALHTLKVDVSGIQSRWGTALGYPYVIQRLQDNLRLLSTLCSKIITVSEWYRKVLIRNGIQEQFVRFIPQAITLPSNAADAAKYPNNNRLKLVFVGRIAPQKGVLLLLKAVAGMDADRVELDLYGEATDPNYQATCREMSLNATNIHWKGRLDKEKVIDTLARYDILCLPSAVCEMSPLVIQEAFAAKVPVVASDNPGNAEQVEHGVKGWLFPSGNVQALTKQLNALADNAALVSEAKQRIGLITPFKDVVSAYLEEYRTMTGEITAVINS